MASNKLDSELKFAERINLRFHLFMCKHCRRYSNQISFIHHAAKNIDQQIESKLELRLSTEKKDHIKNQLNKTA